MWHRSGALASHATAQNGKPRTRQASEDGAVVKGDDAGVGGDQVPKQAPNAGKRSGDDRQAAALAECVVRQHPCGGIEETPPDQIPRPFVWRADAGQTVVVRSIGSQSLCPP